MLITLELSFWTRWVVFNFSSCVCGFTSIVYTVQTLPSKRAPWHTNSSVEESGKGFLKRLAKQGRWLLCPPLHSNWSSFALFLLTTPWLDSCSCPPENVFPTSLCRLSFFLPHCFWSAQQGEGELCRSWKIWRKYYTVHLLSLFFTFEKTQTLNFFTSKENSLWNKKYLVWSCGRWP